MKNNTGFGAHPASSSITIRGSFLGAKHWDVKFTIHLHQVQRLTVGIRQLCFQRSTVPSSFKSWKQFSSQCGIPSQQTSVFKMEDIYVGVTGPAFWEKHGVWCRRSQSINSWSLNSDNLPVPFCTYTFFRISLDYRSYNNFKIRSLLSYMSHSK